MAYLVGADSPDNGPLYTPSRGAGGMLAGYIQGATPKYAKNAGLRADLYRDTMSRIFVRVEEPEIELFKSSIADTHVRDQLLGRLIGDPTTNSGYIDYVLTEMNLQLSENVQIQQGLGDGYTIYAFGQNPPMATFSGVLLNTVQDDQSTNFFRLYLEVLRATALARRSKFVSISVDTDIYSGSMLNLNITKRGSTEVAVPFSFQMVVARIAIINYTVGWTAASVGTPFAADPNAVPFDARLSVANHAPVAVTLRLPGGTTEEGADPRTQQAPPEAHPPDAASRAALLDQALSGQITPDQYAQYVTDRTEQARQALVNQATRGDITPQQLEDGLAQIRRDDAASRSTSASTATAPSAPTPVSPQVGTGPAPETASAGTLSRQQQIDALESTLAATDNTTQAWRQNFDQLQALRAQP